MKENGHRASRADPTETDQQFVQGAHVVDAHGDTIGTLAHYNPTRGFLMVGKGRLFPQDVYIPVTAIDSATADTITLNYTQQEIHDRDWTTPPEQIVPSPSTTKTATAAPTPPSARKGQTADEQAIRVPLREEELVVGKQQHEKGHVHLHRGIVQKQQTVTVPVSHEEVFVERVAGNTNTPSEDDALTECDIDISIMEEQVTVSKRVKTTEEVRLRKELITEQRQFTETVRKERLSVTDDQHLITDGTTPEHDQPLHS